MWSHSKLLVSRHIYQSLRIVFVCHCFGYEFTNAPAGEMLDSKNADDGYCVTWRTVYTVECCDADRYDRCVCIVAYTNERNMSPTYRKVR